MSENSKIGIIIPTLGERHDYLKETIRSSKEFGNVHLLIVAPNESIHSLTNLKSVDQIIPENQPGLPAAINWGFQNLPQEIQYIGWIGDDDLLAPDGGKKSAEFLNNNLGYVMTFGQCRYINGAGKTIGVNALGPI